MSSIKMVYGLIELGQRSVNKKFYSKRNIHAIVHRDTDSSCM